MLKSVLQSDGARRMKESVRLSLDDGLPRVWDGEP